MKENKYLTVIRLFGKSKKNAIALSITLMISFQAIFIFHFVSQFNLKAIENNCYEEYGSYIARMMTNDQQKMTEIAKEDSVESTFACKREELQTQDFYAEYIYAKENKLSSLGSHLLSGTYPKNESEALVDYNYAIKMGWKVDTLLGKTVELPNYKTDQDGEKLNCVVTGVISQKSVFKQEGYQEYTFIFGNDNENENNSLYVQVKDLRNYLSTIKALCSKYDILENQCFANGNIIFGLGFNSEESVFNQYDRMNGILLVLVLIASSIMFYNIIKMYLYKNYDSIAILSLLGVSSRLILRSFVLFLTLLFLIGEVIGGLLSTGIVNMLSEKILHTKENPFTFILQFPVRYYVGYLVVELCILLLLMTPVFSRLLKKSPIELLNSKRGKNIFYKNKMSNSVFRFKEHFFFRKFARNELRYHCISHIMTVSALVISLLLVITGVYYCQLEFNNEATKRNKDIDYTIQSRVVSSGFSSSTTAQLNSLLESLNLDTEVYKVFEERELIKMKSDQLTEKYKDFILSQGYDRSDLYENFSRGKTDIDFVVLGCDQQTIQAIYKENGVSDKEALQEGEAILLKSPLYVIDSSNFSTNIKEGETLTMDDTDIYEGRYKKVDIKHVVDKLPFYPREDQCFCLIINSESFQTYFEKNSYDEIFLKSNLTDKNIILEDVVEQIERMGEPTVIAPKQQHDNLVERNREFTLGIKCLFVLMLVITVILITTNISMRIQLNQVDYAMLDVIGISYGKQQLIVFYQYMVMYLESAVIGSILSYFFTKWMFIAYYDKLGSYMFIYPVRILIFSLIAITVGISIVCVVSFRKLHKMNTVEILQTL